MKASVVLRTRNEAASLPRVLDALFAQKGVEFEVIAVDSGSTDGGPDLLAERGMRVIHLAAERFSYGRALNLGCQEASGDVLVFLSAHALPGGEDWMRSLIKPLKDDESLAGVGGAENGRIPGLPGVRAPLKLDLEGYRRNPYAGLVNANAAIRRDIWNRFPFNEDLTGAEDKEWTMRVLAAGYKVLLVPAADVEHRHAENLALSYRRGFREHLAFREFGAPIGPYSLLRFLREVAAAPLGSLGGRLGEWPRYAARCWGKYRALAGAPAPKDLYGR